MYSSRSNLIIGFHGCDEEVGLQLLNNPKKIKISDKPFDWLGHGFYIFGKIITSVHYAEPRIKKKRAKSKKHR